MPVTQQLSIHLVQDPHGLVVSRTEIGTQEERSRPGQEHHARGCYFHRQPTIPNDAGRTCMQAASGRWRRPPCGNINGRRRWAKNSSLLSLSALKIIGGGRGKKAISASRFANRHRLHSGVRGKICQISRFHGCRLGAVFSSSGLCRGEHAPHLFLESGGLAGWLRCCARGRSFISRGVHWFVVAKGAGRRMNLWVGLEGAPLLLRVVALKS